MSMGEEARTALQVPVCRANGLAPYIMHHHNSVPDGLLTAAVYFAM